MSEGTDPADQEELAWLRACYQALRDHVHADHELTVTGNANQIEAAHLRAHRAQGSAWHDAWRLPRPDAHPHRQPEESSR